MKLEFSENKPVVVSRNYQFSTVFDKLAQRYANKCEFNYFKVDTQLW